MPKKVARFSLEKRQLVLLHHAEGKTVKEITSALQMSYATVYRIIMKPSGRSAELSATDQHCIVQRVAENLQVSAPQIAIQLSTSSGTTISAQTGVSK